MEDGFVTISREYLKELEEKAKGSEYYKGRADALQYVIVTIENILTAERSE